MAFYLEYLWIDLFVDLKAFEAELGSLTDESTKNLSKRFLMLWLAL